MPRSGASRPCQVAVIWIDWYPYHVARFRGMAEHPALKGTVVGVEMVGGVGVHAGLKFREPLPKDLWVETLEPASSWHAVEKWPLARTLWRKLNTLDPEVVLVPGYYTLPAVAAALWAKLHGRSSVLMTESTAADHRRVSWKEALKGLVIRTLFDWAVTGGKAHVAYLRQLGFPLDRILGCYDVVDNDFFAQVRPQSPSRQEDQSNFLYVGRLAEEKNVAGLLRAWEAYRGAGGTWGLVLCGDGPQRITLEAAVRQSAWASEVQFTGLKVSAELLPLYAAAECFVLPSTREPWGLVVNEAMAAGLPVLVSDRCGCRGDLVEEGRNGFSFNPEIEGALAERMLHVDRMTPEARSAMGKASRQIIARYTPEGFGNSVAQIARSRRRSPVDLTREVAE